MEYGWVHAGLVALLLLLIVSLIGHMRSLGRTD
jgi:hypothetical protein